MPTLVESCGPANGPIRTIALVEIAAMTLLVLSYIWIWHGVFRGDFLLVAALYFGLGALSHLRRGESPKVLGLRLDNWAPAARNAGAVIAIGVCTPLAVGAAWGTWHFEPPRMLFATIPWLIVWATSQQYGLLCFLYRRFLDIFASPRGASLGASLVFALFHIPNPLLMAVTLLAGIVSCTLYRRVPNVFVLGVGHAAISFMLFSALPLTLTHQMRVGPGYFLVQ